MAVLAWVFVLRSRVRDQTAVIRQKLRQESALEQRYRDLFENAIDMVYTLDLSRKFISLNPAGERITGYSLEEALGLNAGELIDPEYADSQQRIWDQRLTGQESAAFELGIVAKDGRRVTLEVSAHLMHQDGKAVAVEGIARDVTSRNRAQEELRASEERYRHLFDSNPLPAWVYDVATLEFLAVNEAAVRHYGYSRQEFPCGCPTFARSKTLRI